MWGLIVVGLLGVVTWMVFGVVPPAEGMGYWVRIMFFHVPMAWIAVLGFLLSAWWAFRYLRTKDLAFYQRSSTSARLGIVFCVLATVSGAIFANATWGTYWNWDPRQTTIFILLLIYAAFVTLEFSINDEEKRARIASVYALLSFVTVPFLVFIIPRFYQSLHPDPIINSSSKINMDNVMLIVLMASLATFTAAFVWLLQFSLKRKAAKNLQNELGGELE